MTEQDLGRDPVTGKKLKRPPSGDAAQNLHHTPTPQPNLVARDYSRPQTIPKEEFEETTGQDHGEACTAWQVEQDKRKADQAALDRVDE